MLQLGPACKNAELLYCTLYSVQYKGEKGKCRPYFIGSLACSGSRTLTLLYNLTLGVVGRETMYREKANVVVSF